MSERKRLTLTGNKMPADVYEKLEKLGIERKLTPYICSLVEKEETMDKLIGGLSILMDKLDNVENIVAELNHKFVDTAIQANYTPVSIPNTVETEVIPEGKLNISNNIVGGIVEEIEELDF